MSPVLRKNSRGRQNPTCNLCYSTSRAKRKPLISKGMLGAYKFLRSHRPRNRRTRGKSMQHLGYSPTAEAGNDRYHELVVPLLKACQPANLVRMPFSTPATLAQAYRKLTLDLSRISGGDVRLVFHRRRSRRSYAKQKRTPRPERKYFLFSRGPTAGTQSSSCTIALTKNLTLDC